MATRIKTKKGLNIIMEGKPKFNTVELVNPEEVRLVPDHYPIIPKLSVKVGDKVQAGSPVLFHKNNPDILVTSPISGEITAINRGERRKILEIVIASDKKDKFKKFTTPDPKKKELDAWKKVLMEAGLWAYIKERPFDRVANPNAEPKSIFISTYDTAPLAPCYEYIVKGEEDAFQAGLNIIAKLSKGKTFLGVKSGSDFSTFTQAKKVEVVELEGPHPAGNPSVMIQQLDAIDRGETVWTLSPLAVLFIGRFVLNGTVDFTKKVALTGPEIVTPQYYQTIIGANISEFIKDNVYGGKKLRCISGNVLTGTHIPEDGYVGAVDSQVTVIAEGDDTHELFGWAMPRFNNHSVSRLYPSWLLGKKQKTKFDARILGGKRAIIMSGEYAKVFPFDILPEFLIKAMITKDFDKMEALGIYELIAEDFALCEYVCTSKLEIQKITKEAMAYMIEETE